MPEIEILPVYPIHERVPVCPVCRRPMTLGCRFFRCPAGCGDTRVIDSHGWNSVAAFRARMAA